MIYSAVRDREWLTINPVITDEKIEVHPDSFRIEFKCIYKAGEINFSAGYRIEGNADNTVSFSFEGKALGTFEKSRIGFCILHPVEGCAGNPCIITHTEGNSESVPFPVYISPDQIFTDIKSMKWDADRTECTLVFSGDIFETEDQRNWTDASYKTYCTPLNLPCPATIRKGEKIWQRIEFKAEGGDIVETGENRGINININPIITSDMPLTGIGQSSRPSPLSIDEIRILRELHFDHYRVDLYLFRPAWKEEADLAAREAAALNWPLELALFFDENSNSQLEDFIDWLLIHNPGISVITLLHKCEAVTPDLFLVTFAPRLKEILPAVIIGCGTNANFAQINREMPDLVNTDLFSFSIHPQEHASDNTTLVENLKGQSYSVESAIQIAQGKGIWLSSVNLQRRFNANIENYETPSPGDAFPPQADSRIMSLFGACWTAGSMKYLSESGARGITYYETAGERGIIQGDFDSRWPEHFRTSKGMIFPIYHFFNWLLKDKSFKLIRSKSSSPLEVDCLALSNGRLIKLALVNFTSADQNIMIHGFSGEIKTKVLNSESYADAAADFKWIEKNWQKVLYAKEPWVAGPYSINFLEGFIINHGVARSSKE